MSVAKAYAAELIGLTAEIVTVEVDISNGLHAFSVVGLGDRSVEEAKDRISAAIKNIGLVSPKQKNQKVVISLAPADLRKEGTSFDLPMAVAYLSAAGDAELSPEGKIFLGELSLDGQIRRASGVLPMLCQAAVKGFKEAFIPVENAEEASLSRGIAIYPVSSLQDLLDHLSGKARLEPLSAAGPLFASGQEDSFDMRDIRGNSAAKRGLEIAAAGAHNVILYGPPGTGKTMLAQSFRSILPSLTYEESVEVTSIHSAAKMLQGGLITRPPLRSPHHTASYPSIVGGGPFPRPGEITLAHRGVLFLDEFPEFDRSVIEALRQPMEDRVITISRARGVITFPARCILIASMNPCPCGRGKGHGCTCPSNVFEAYRRRISGPIMDRLDIWLNVEKVDYVRLAEAESHAEDSASVRARVEAARLVQHRRFFSGGSGLSFNSEMGPQEIERFIVMADGARGMLRSYAKKLGLSGRAFHRVMKVAQTIADLDGLAAPGEK
ncbi:MAG: YifB family Mg chelatase-like AAA ATPase, partial [Patescibacteria group bacterium]|nr:YifB family Mg chelatase-like AAA ATPase [Patescibacteria group bacterium]